jgi:hypothetical protein
MTPLILTVFLFLAPPSVNELSIHPDSDSIEAELIHTLEDARNALGVEVFHYEKYEAEQVHQDKFEFVETKIELTPEDGGKKRRLSIWMPNRLITGNDFILVSKPGIITPQTVMLANELLMSL